jgi:hypothetical protein
MTPKERFAGLEPMVQDRLLRMVHLLGGASQHEKEEAQWLIARAADNLREQIDIQPTTELLDTLANLAMWMRHAADPKENMNGRQ